MEEVARVPAQSASARRLRVWYISSQRVTELLPIEGLPRPCREALTAPRTHDNSLRLAMMLEPTMLELLGSGNAPALHELAALDQIEVGRHFVIEARFRSSGLAAASRSSTVTLTSDVDGILAGRTLRVTFGKDGLTCQTAHFHLQGRPRVFVFAVISAVSESEVTALPVFVADLVFRGEGILALPVSSGLEIHPSDVHEFAEVDFRKRIDRADLGKLRSVPESAVKEVLADIFGEFEPPKDWGGEQCDLFSSNVTVRGRRRTAAFLLKGPAKFHEMTPADCGKNGDQIYRLFNTGAELMVIQHCHRVSPAVRRTVEAFALAESRGDVNFLILDGSDTFRLLRSRGIV